MRYRVTDGGTVENRGKGQVTLYYEIGDALDRLGERMPADEWARVTPLLDSRWPPLHVLIADA